MSNDGNLASATERPATAPLQPSPAVSALVQRCLAAATTHGATSALDAICAGLRTEHAQIWLDCARLLLQLGQPALAAALLDRAAAAGLAPAHATYWLAQALWQAGAVDRAEAQLRLMLAAAVDIDAAVLLAQVLRGQGRFNAAVAAMQLSMDAPGADHAQLMRVVQFVRECQRQDVGLVLCDLALAKRYADPELHALAGNLAQELGKFDAAEQHYRAALAQGVDLNRWFVLHSLAMLKRHSASGNADLELLQAHAHDPALTPLARASVLFALGKAHDDGGNFAAAAIAWREANSLRRASGRWSRSHWEAWLAARLTAGPWPATAVEDRSACPIFVVGLPRTGTTLVAQWLGRQPQVCNRGELPTLPYLAERLATVDLAQLPSAIREAAALYRAHVQRDEPRRPWYVDKNPLNWRYLDAVMAMFPHAHVVICQRDRRDTALSIWSQSFAHADYAFAADFADIAAVADGFDRLLAHWRQTLPLAIHTVEYEQLVHDPERTMEWLSAQIGLDRPEPVRDATDPGGVITSASQWQARQPVHTRSIGRSQRYARFLPEMQRWFKP